MDRFFGLRQFHRIGQLLLGCVLVTSVWVAGAWVTGPTSAEAADYRQIYAQGRLYFRQRLYHDAKKAFLRAIKQTARGKRSFSAHYYLARCYYKTGSISLAIRMLEKAKERIKRGAHKSAYKRFAGKILALYGKLTIAPEVDPDEVGRIKLKLAPKTAFSNKDKANFFKSVMAKIKRQGGLKLDNKPIYLPKGEYEISIERDQCLLLGFFQGEAVAKEFTIGDSAASLSVKAKRSCSCPSNQTVLKEGKRLYCACAKGTGWNKSKNQCEIVKQVNAWPWIITGIGVVVVGGTIATVAAVTQNDGRRSFQFTGPKGAQVQAWTN